eukprot:NODE_6353_length_285_cov_152.572034_g5741_i0.p1 GENE.NODE_6353_length_285_cov_152.572034_g5741_i0~~NODE_6353_length_285_cov_152.572034_g5741_i0.p1  ORF type:complete len:64 (-),score=28.37 NODE_6353_length_285_cov_152.572034_g5741_i0:92-259(-)
MGAEKERQQSQFQAKMAEVYKKLTMNQQMGRDPFEGLSNEERQFAMMMAGAGGGE